MVLKERINADYIEAFKNKNTVKKMVLSVLKGAIQTQEGKMIISTDENVIKSVKSMEKGLVETLEGLKKINASAEQIAQVEEEISYLKPYLPELMSDEEMRKLAKEIVAKAENKNIGFLMGMFMKETQPKGIAVDAKAANNILKEELACLAQQ